MSVTTPAPVTTDLLVDDRTRAAFERDGFVKLRSVLDPAVVDAWAPVITETVIDLHTQHLPMEEHDTYGKAFLQISNIW